MKAAFLDRDGVINHDFGYIDSWKRFSFIDGIEIVLKELIERGFTLFVVTNQSGIARGYFTEETLQKIHHKMIISLNIKGIEIKDIFYCPHHPNGSVEKFSIDCSCRKPSPGLIFQAKQKHDIDLASSILIGDKLSDVRAGELAGVSKLFFLSENPFISSKNVLRIKTIHEVWRFLN